MSVSSVSSMIAPRFSRAIVAALGPEFAGTDPVLRPSQFADIQRHPGGVGNLQAVRTPALGGRCEICGGRGPKWVECHEIWHYDDVRQIQTLVGLIALCPPCHEVKHIGRAAVTGNLVRAIEHLCRVNQGEPEHAEAYIEVQFEIHALRSRHQRELDIGSLKTLGIHARVGDRQ